ncbi:polysaccharide biosynthesis tyrosine autokinase [Aetokthonos hydrillicola Thurmond2011]|jgi:capsular exopolysaccharide synthesis family protein|uniref:non-specific protein-tyrosine kinase n=1 Tax=Aetokthonos hydrillicola Thurmond2011 TaxID=2712845 RepID=A0AAP5I1V2_9CYAN|nr:tyrosine-protein kinase domain-containing protein [Aetokthonos hydrillicola]MBO3463195.1 polysaccharide biosynthesis tyrosine autokinase [Aetokthonos hydrillicola CCALA 1050]MBW4589570.1 polysaccharide biosynthesis tyrosine autokinase [Aetokthonos hydrillicola CCALA 1050]MDR9893170.1 polysaccharide biosynthesis tyrosine autokinase [Aetokthonos hydrillicola Thurmond2011]
MKFNHIHSLQSNNSNNGAKELIHLEQDKSQELNKSGVNLVRNSVEVFDSDDSEAPKKGLNLRPILRTIQRNTLLVVAITAATTIASVFVLPKSPRIYEGTFQLLVEPITSEAKLTDPSVLSRNENLLMAFSVDYPTLLQVLQSPSLLTKISKQIQVQYPNFKNDTLSRDLVNKNLVIRRVGTNLSDFTKLIEVHYKGKDSAQVEFVLKAILNEYLKYGLENRKTHISSAVEFIESQLPRLQKQVNNLQGQLQVLQQDYQLSNPTNDAGALSQRFREIQTQRFNVQRELSEQKTLYVNLQKQLNLAENEALTASTLSEDPSYRDLLTQKRNIESQIAIKSVQLTQDHPIMQSLWQQQRNISLLLDQQAQHIAGQSLPSRVTKPQILNFQNSTRQSLIKQLMDTSNNIHLLEVRNQAFTKAETSLNQQVLQFPAITRRYNDLQQQLEITTKTLNQLLVQRETLRVEAAQKEVPWQVASEATIPRDIAGKPIPVPGDTGKKLGMAIFIGLILGISSALLIDKLRNVFHTTDDIRDAITETPVLEVPPVAQSKSQFSKTTTVPSSLEENKAEQPNASLVLETFISLYTSIRFLTSRSPVRSLLVCSPETKDGKTRTAFHLAQAAAIKGQKVLLVDANLRHPQLHTMFGLPNLSGLSNILSENLEPQKFIQRSPLENNLFLLTAGQLLKNPSRLVASSRMHYLIKEFEANFDLVIYDTSHFLGFADTKLLATDIDGVLMVVQVGKTHRSAVTQVLNQLKASNLPIISIVAN